MVIPLAFSCACKPMESVEVAVSTGLVGAADLRDNVAERPAVGGRSTSALTADG